MTKAEFEKLKEDLAAQAHTAWAGWMKYLFLKATPCTDGSVNIPAYLVARWQRQMLTSYAELPENEKESDREEARKYLAILMVDGRRVGGH
ncbi:MAG: hypothetical protein A2Y38_08065 [Spirochaetes bacterium GWB1_59_5]|nr:MAG: hypothetical protein A2Y38_08065 [Spirochaetes bacterium GWB1_59_5]